MLDGSSPAGLTSSTCRRNLNQRSHYCGLRRPVKNKSPSSPSYFLRLTPSLECRHPQAQRAIDFDAPTSSLTSSGNRTSPSRRSVTTPMVHKPVSLAPVAPWITPALTVCLTRATPTISRAFDSGNSSTSTVSLPPLTRALARLSLAKGSDGVLLTPEKP